MVGLSRSGLHVFIEWILQQTEGTYLHLNSAEGKADPFTTARPLGPDPDGPTWQSNDPELAHRPVEDLRIRPRDLLLVHYEDSFLAHALSPWYEERHDALVGESRERHDIVLVRDPFNLFASRRQSGVGLIPSRNAMRVWRQHVRADGRTRSRNLPRRPLVISYNRWAGDRDYRRRVAEALGIPFTDAGRDRIPTTLGGSSFDGTQYDGRPDKMRVFERWRHMVDDSIYQTLFEPDIIALARERFCEGPGAAEVQAAAEHFAARPERAPKTATPSTSAPMA